MFLREISLGIFRQDYEREMYLRAAEHVAEIFVRFLPRKYTLDGMSKTNITLGRVQGQPRYRQWINVNEYHYEEFDFAAYDLASPEIKDDMVLSAIECSLLDIAASHGSDSEPIRKAAAATRECRFELRGYTKLSRFTRSRKLHIKVFQRYSRDGIAWGIDIASPKGEVFETHCITPKTDSTRSAYGYRKSHWVEDRFVILDFLGKPSYTLDVAPVERRLFGEDSRRTGR